MAVAAVLCPEAGGVVRMAALAEEAAPNNSVFGADKVGRECLHSTLFPTKLRQPDAAVNLLLAETTTLAV